MRNLIGYLALLVCAPVLLAADPLANTLAAMDGSAASFTGVKAAVRKASYTAIIDDESVESGTMWMARSRK